MMATMVILTVLAALGCMSVLWALFGFLLPGQRGTAMVYLWRDHAEGEQALRHFGWLRGLGLIRCPLLLVDCEITEEERTRLLKNRPGVEICTMEELPSRLEQECQKLGRTGT
jgi:hypothetical protein